MHQGAIGNKTSSKNKSKGPAFEDIKTCLPFCLGEEMGHGGWQARPKEREGRKREKKKERRFSLCAGLVAFGGVVALSDSGSS